MSSSAEAKKPASYYDLLKVKPFESDIGLIRKHFKKIVEQIRAKIAAEPASPRLLGALPADAVTDALAQGAALLRA